MPQPESSEALAYEACARAALSAISAAERRDAESGTRSLGRAQRQMRLLCGVLPPHARRVRVSKQIVERAEKAVQAAACRRTDRELAKACSAARRSSELALSR